MANIRHRNSGRIADVVLGMIARQLGNELKDALSQHPDDDPELAEQVDGLLDLIGGGKNILVRLSLGFYEEGNEEAAAAFQTTTVIDNEVFE